MLTGGERRLDLECDVKTKTHPGHPASASSYQRSRPDTQAHPRRIISAASKEMGVDAKARSFSVRSHLGTMIFAHALSLNDICDWLRLKSRAIAAFGLTPPSLNNLSNSNKVRGPLHRAGLLAHAGALAPLRHELRAAAPRRQFTRPFALLQSEHPCHGLDRDGTGGQLHELDQTPQPQPRPLGRGPDRLRRRSSPQGEGARGAKEPVGRRSPWGGD